MMTGVLGAPELPRPNIPGLIDGIVDTDPMVLQCRDCGSTLTQPEGMGVAVFIILSGWHFHRCDGRGGLRRCRECLARIASECGSARCGR